MKKIWVTSVNLNKLFPSGSTFKQYYNCQHGQSTNYPLLKKISKLFYFANWLGRVNFNLIKKKMH